MKKKRINDNEFSDIAREFCSRFGGGNECLDELHTMTRQSERRVIKVITENDKLMTKKQIKERVMDEYGLTSQGNVINTINSMIYGMYPRHDRPVLERGRHVITTNDRIDLRILAKMVEIDAPVSVSELQWYVNVPEKSLSKRLSKLQKEGDVYVRVVDGERKFERE